MQLLCRFFQILLELKRQSVVLEVNIYQRIFYNLATLTLFLIMADLIRKGTLLESGALKYKGFIL